MFENSYNFDKRFIGFLIATECIILNIYSPCGFPKGRLHIDICLSNRRGYAGMSLFRVLSLCLHCIHSYTTYGQQVM